MASSSSSPPPPPPADTCLNFIIHLLIAFKDKLKNLLFPEQILEEVVAPRSQALPEAIASSSSSSSSSRQMMTYQVFLSFRGEDTRHNFTDHLRQALKNRGINIVFFDEYALEKGDDQLLPALSEAIKDSNLSLIILSKDYASSKSCLAQLSDIMDHNRAQQHIVLPIFYHVDPWHVRNISGSFKTSFDEHESKGVDQVQLQRWKHAFVEVGKLKGWQFDRPKTEHIEDLANYVTKKLKNSTLRSSSKEVVGIEDQKEMILRLIEEEENRVIGLWGQVGIGKTTLVQAVYDEVSPKFEDGCFLQNVGEEIEKQGKESVRNELLSNLLNEKDIRFLDTPSKKEYPYRERMNNKKVIVVLDDVNDSDQIEYLGVKHFGHGSKIIITSRDRQVLIIGGADKIHAVNKLNEEDSFQLFSKYAFQSLNPDEEFLDLSREFLESAQGNPLALTVLGSQLYDTPREKWESELEKLKEYEHQGISKILKSCYDGLGEVEKDIFLDIAIFYKWKPKKEVEAILSGRYGEDDAVISAISSLHDKCLIETVYEDPDLHRFSMHDMLQGMGKAIVRQESTNPFKRSRLWETQHVVRVLKYNQGTDDIVGIKLELDQIDNLRLHPSAFKNMYNLKYICFETWENPFAVEDDNIPDLPDGLRLLQWPGYPFKSLSTSFNPKNLGFLNLSHGDMEQLWSEDVHLLNLRGIIVSYCKNLRKIPDLSGATKLKIFKANGCESLVELPCLNHCELLDEQELELSGCKNLEKFPELPNEVSRLDLSGTRIEEVPDSIERLVKLEKLDMNGSNVQKVSSNISKMESLTSLDLSGCPIIEFPENPRSLTKLRLSWTPIRKLECNPTLSVLDAKHCGSLEQVSFPDQKSYQFDPIDDWYYSCASLMFFCGCVSLGQDSVGNIEANAMFKIECLAKKWAWKIAQWESAHAQEGNGDGLSLKNCWGRQSELVCCFPSDLYLANKFEHQSENSSISLKISREECDGRSKFLAFSIYLVADLTDLSRHFSLCTCEYKLTTVGGAGHRKFRSKWNFHQNLQCEGDHVLILFGRDMIKKDENYEEASFEIKMSSYGKGYKEVKKCGVHVSYVDDEESSSNTQQT